MSKKLRVSIVIIGTLLALTTACTPAQIAAYNRMTPAQKNEVHKYLQRQQPSRDCHQAIDRHWPASSRATAHRVMVRESRNIAHAKNASSSATGCMQLLSMHDHRYYAVGCTPAQKRQPDCNIKAAVHLFRAAGGWSPWAQTV